MFYSYQRPPTQSIANADCRDNENLHRVLDSSDKLVTLDLAHKKTSVVVVDPRHRQCRLRTNAQIAKSQLFSATFTLINGTPDDEWRGLEIEREVISSHLK